MWIKFAIMWWESSDIPWKLVQITMLHGEHTLSARE
jgi:hypothetical protein